MKSLFFVSLLCCVYYCTSMGVPHGEYPDIDRWSANEIKTDNICSLPLETGVCRALFFRYGFDKTQKRCVEFMYGGCSGNANNFRTLEECQQSCP